MSKKVEIEFSVDFSTDRVIPKHLGRIQLGNHIGRLMLFPDGQVRLGISNTAKTDGSIVFVESNDGVLFI